MPISTLSHPEIFSDGFESDPLHQLTLRRLYIEHQILVITVITLFALSG